MAPALPATGQALAPSPEATQKPKERKTASGRSLARSVPPCLTIRQLPANHSTDGQQAATQQQQAARLRDYLARCNGNVVERDVRRIISERKGDGVAAGSRLLEREQRPSAVCSRVGLAEYLSAIPGSAEVTGVVPNGGHPEAKGVGVTSDIAEGLAEGSIAAYRTQNGVKSAVLGGGIDVDRKSTRLNSSHL